MSKFARGTLVLVPFPFIDLSTFKVRPAVVISGDTIHIDDAIVLFVTSKNVHPALDTDYILEEEHPDFAKTKLKTTSTFRAHKLVTLKKSMIIGRLGSLTSSIQKELDKHIRMALAI